jgi:hypothetical protein
VRGVPSELIDMDFSPFSWVELREILPSVVGWAAFDQRCIRRSCVALQSGDDLARNEMRSTFDMVPMYVEIALD